MYLKRVFKKLGENAATSAAADGSLWMNFVGEEAPLRIGISASNIFVAAASQSGTAVEP